MDKPEHFPSCCLTVRPQVDRHGGQGDMNVNWMLIVQAVGVKPEGPTVLSWWWNYKGPRPRPSPGQMEPLDQSSHSCWGIWGLETHEGRVA